MVKTRVNQRGKIVSVVNENPKCYAIDSMIDPITRRVHVSVSDLGLQYKSFLLDKTNNRIVSFSNKLSRETGRVVINGSFVPKDENGNEVIATHIAIGKNWMTGESLLFVSTTENKVRFYDLRGGRPTKYYHGNQFFFQYPTEVTALDHFSPYEDILYVGLSDGTFTMNEGEMIYKIGFPAEYKQVYYPGNPRDLKYFKALADENTRPIKSFLVFNFWSAINSEGMNLLSLEYLNGIPLCEPNNVCYVSFDFRKMANQSNRNFLYCLSSDGLLLIEDIPTPIPPRTYPVYILDSNLSAIVRSANFERENSNAISCDNAIANANEALSLMRQKNWIPGQMNSRMLEFRGDSCPKKGGGRYEKGIANQMHFSYSMPFSVSYEGPYPIKKKCRIRIVALHFRPEDYSSPDARPNADFIMSPENRVFSMRNPNELLQIYQSITSPPEENFSFGFLNPDAEDLVLFSTCSYADDAYHAGAFDSGFTCTGLSYGVHCPLEIWDYIVLDFNSPNGQYYIQLDKEYHDVAIHPDDY